MNMNNNLVLLVLLSISIAVNGYYLRGVPEDTRRLKMNAAQKRQENRDSRRRRWGIHRTDADAHRERERKHAQANNRGRDEVDPYEPGHGDKNYALNREIERDSRCQEYGLAEDCGWAALDYDWPNGGHGGRDRDFVHGTHYPYP